MTFVTKLFRCLTYRHASELINKEIDVALKDLKATAAETNRTLQERYRPNAQLRAALNRAQQETMTDGFADFEEMIRRRRNDVH